jgi:hypothetical protein
MPLFNRAQLAVLAVFMALLTAVPAGAARIDSHGSPS